MEAEPAWGWGWGPQIAADGAGPDTTVEEDFQGPLAAVFALHPFMTNSRLKGHHEVDEYLYLQDTCFNKMGGFAVSLTSWRRCSALCSALPRASSLRVRSEAALPRRQDNRFT